MHCINSPVETSSFCFWREKNINRLLTVITLLTRGYLTSELTSFSKSFIVLDILNLEHSLTDIPVMIKVCVLMCAN